MKLLRAWCFRIVMEILSRVPGVRKLVFFYPIWDQLGEELPPWEERLLVRLGRRYLEKRWPLGSNVCRLRYGYVIIHEYDGLVVDHENKFHHHPTSGVMLSRAGPARSRTVFAACLSGIGGDLLREFPSCANLRIGGDVLDTKEEADLIRTAEILGGQG